MIYDFIKGMTLAEASKWLGMDGFEVRETRRDGQPLVVTRDYKFNRVNVYTVDGKIVEVKNTG